MNFYEASALLDALRFDFTGLNRAAIFESAELLTVHRWERCIQRVEFFVLACRGHGSSFPVPVFRYRLLLYVTVKKLLFGLLRP
jgi:hypothetical protein